MSSGGGTNSIIIKDCILIWHPINFRISMDVMVVGEENVKAYVRGIIEDRLDYIVIHHRVNTHIEGESELITEEYVEEEDETKDVDTSVEVLDEGIDLEFVDPLSPINKETSSIVKRSDLPRGITNDWPCWAEDSVSQDKVFSLSGFVSRGGHFTDEVVEEERKKIIAGITALGGTILGGDKWDEDITHVVTFCLADMERMTEKIMCALAAGKWIVTPKYVKRSLQAGEWLSPLKYAWNPRAVERRKNYLIQGPVCGTLFWKMKAVFLMKDEKTEDFCGRLVSAGGGKVTSYYSSIDSMIKHHSSLYRMVTHVFFDNVQEMAASSRFRLLVKKTEDKGIKYLYYK